MIICWGVGKSKSYTIQVSTSNSGQTQWTLPISFSNTTYKCSTTAWICTSDASRIGSFCIYQKTNTQVKGDAIWLNPSGYGTYNNISIDYICSGY